MPKTPNKKWPNDSKSPESQGFLVPELLRRRLARRQCVAFVGAGFSMSCGMPNWEGLLKHLVQAARDARRAEGSDLSSLDVCSGAIAAKQFMMAASLVRKLLPPSDLDEAVRQCFGDHKLSQASESQQETTNARLKALVQGPWAGIVTTNYDTLIERALGQFTDREVVTVSEDNPRLGAILASSPAGGLFFVKTDGSISGGRVVLSTEEYDRTYLGSPRMNSFLSALCLRYHLVFIGCSLEDELVRIRRKLAVDFDGLIPTAYALLPHTSDNRGRADWLREVAKIDPILYTASDPEHRAVAEFLVEAAACADPATGRGTNEELTRTEFVKLAIPNRLDRVGTINRELLHMIRARPKHTIDHKDLVGVSLLGKVDVGPQLEILSPEERVYRVLFLVSVGLLSERRAAGGRVVYAMPREVVTALAGRRRRDSERSTASDESIMHKWRKQTDGRQGGNDGVG
jgi:hypothetical protein